MSRVPFSVLESNFPAKGRVKPQELYASIGHPEKLAFAMVLGNLK